VRFRPAKQATLPMVIETSICKDWTVRRMAGGVYCIGLYWK